MEIKFKFIDEKDIKIIGVQDGVEKEIGCIFTPSSSSQNIKNAIQVCGISQVFDYWGCVRYYQPDNIYNPPRAVIDALKDKKEGYTQMKDIQIMFEFGTEPTRIINTFKEAKMCYGCFNFPCTCDNTGNHTHISPYNVVREEDIKDKLEFLKDEKGVSHLSSKETEEYLEKNRLNK